MKDWLMLASIGVMFVVYLVLLVDAIRAVPPVPDTRRADFARVGQAAARAAEGFDQVRSALADVGSAMRQTADVLRSPYEPSNREKGDPA